MFPENKQTDSDPFGGFDKYLLRGLSAMQFNPYLVAWILLTSILSACSDNATGQNSVAHPILTPEQEFSDLQRKAVAGDANAQFELGEAFESGKGVPRDFSMAMKWWETAAGHGNPNALVNVFLSRCAKSASPDDYLAALELLKNAVQQIDNKYAILTLGLFFGGQQIKLSNGICKAPAQLQDQKMAFQWLIKSAGQEVGMAQVLVGKYYLRGEVIEKDVEKAIEWFNKAAEKGYADAQYELGLLYDTGTGVTEDAELAAELYEKAAEQGSVDAQIQLARMYYLGRGGRNDKVLAYMWANIAAAKDKVATIDTWAIGKSMAPEQIAEAQRLSRNWKPSVRQAENTQNGDDREKTLYYTGTAFFVSHQGHLLTNFHIVKSCGQIRIAGFNNRVEIINHDQANDLSLLKIDGKSPAVAIFRRANDLKQGEIIMVYGYPLNGTLATNGNFTPGVVSASAGLGNNSSQIQITAPVQQGNSGGPVLDENGEVVGVVVEKLDAVEVARRTGDVPQNVNFAINEATARAFLDNNHVPYKTSRWWGFVSKDSTSIADDASKFTVVVQCWR